jgi:glycosyltransferase involved in cell wall biosynthesis
MHILYIHQYFCPPGGAGNNRSFELAKAWVKAGHKVTMLTSTAYFPIHLKFEASRKSWNCEGIEVIALNVDYAHSMRFRRRVIAFLGFFFQGMRLAKGLPKPDIIYASSTPPTVGEMGRRLSKRWKVPFVFEVVDVWPDVPIGMGILRNPLLIKWMHSRTNRIYKAANAIVALSDGMKAQILAQGVPSYKVTVSYNGTNLAAFPYVRRTSKPTVEVIYPGTVGIANGVDAVIRLAAAVENLGRKDIRFTILGGGNDLARVKELARTAGLTNLRFLDSVPKEEVAPILAMADIGLVTFAPYPVLEANSANKFYDFLASGLPVLTNYEGWQARYLRDHACGLATQMRDDAALLQNLLRLADDPQLRMEMGKNGRALAERVFDRNVIANELLEMFRTILG